MKRAVAILIILAWIALGAFFLFFDDRGGSQSKVIAFPASAPTQPTPPAEPVKPIAKAPPVDVTKKPEPVDAPKKAEPVKPEPAKPEAAKANEIAALIQASEETILSSQMAGRIRKVFVGLGDEAQSGTTLIEFDCGEQRAQLASAEADYRSARETHVARLKLQALGAAGELEVTVAAAAADKARSQVVLRREQVAYCSVEAPFRSRVARLRVKGAESVQAGQPLVDLVNSASLKAQIFVPAAWITWLKPGTPLVIHTGNGENYQARVTKLNSRVDGVSQQLELEARIDNGEGLVPGMVGVAAFNPPK